MSPSELSQTRIADTEVVADLVNDGASYLIDNLVLGGTDRADRSPIDGDAVGQYSGIRGCSLRERNSLVQTEESGWASFELNRDRNIGHFATEFGWQGVQGTFDHFLELSVVDVDHLPIVRVSRRSGCVHLETVQRTAKLVGWPMICTSVTNSRLSFLC